MKLIPLNRVDDQIFPITIDQETYRFRLLDRGTAGLFLDVHKGQNPLLTGILCLDRVRLIRSAYLRFPGDLMFADQQGVQTPTFWGFGDRFLLYFLERNEQDVGV